MLQILPNREALLLLFWRYSAALPVGVSSAFHCNVREHTVSCLNRLLRPNRGPMLRIQKLGRSFTIHSFIMKICIAPLQFDNNRSAKGSTFQNNGIHPERRVAERRVQAPQLPNWETRME